MLKTLTVSEAKPHLGSLLDQVSKGLEVFIRRKERLYRVEEVAEVAPIPMRPVGYFRFEADDLTSLANRAAPSFIPEE